MRNGCEEKSGAPKGGLPDFNFSWWWVCRKCSGFSVHLGVFWVILKGPPKQTGKLRSSPTLAGTGMPGAPRRRDE